MVQEVGFEPTPTNTQELYNLCITRIDTALDASSVANIAMSYTEQKQLTDNVLSNVPEVN